MILNILFWIEFSDGTALNSFFLWLMADSEVDQSVEEVALPQPVRTVGELQTYSSAARRLCLTVCRHGVFQSSTPLQLPRCQCFSTVRIQPLSRLCCVLSVCVVCAWQKTPFDDLSRTPTATKVTPQIMISFICVGGLVTA